MSRVTTCVAVLVGCLLSVGCEKKGEEFTQRSARELTGAEKDLIGANNRFSLKLFRKMVEDGRDANIVISPFSISMGLGMTCNGADGTTREAMKRTLEWSDLSLESVNESSRSLMRLVEGIDPHVELKIANSIWHDRRLAVEKEFIDLSKRYFNAEVTGLDFSEADASNIINEWISEATNGRIKQIVDEVIDTNVVMCVISGSHFKGVWMYQFDEEDTKDDWFLLPDGSPKPCKMMEQRGEYDYFSTDHFQALDLPYGEGLFRMTIFLPSPGNHIDSLIAEFNEGNWDGWMRSFSKDSGDVFVPKFTVESEDTLNEVVRALGMGIAFSPAARFTRISKSGGIWIFWVTQKSCVEVNEEGTEAAAAASVVLGKGPSPSGFKFRVDRPFVFVIRERHSQTILFLGRVVEPLFL